VVIPNEVRNPSGFERPKKEEFLTLLGMMGKNYFFERSLSRTVLFSM